MVQIIAEAGVNHDGSLEDALQLIDAAVDGGADTVKFQTFVAERLVTRAAPKSAYQLRSTSPEESSLAMLSRLELSPDDHRTLVDRCAERGIEFLSTPFDPGSLELLLDLGLQTIKVSSGDLTNGPLLCAIARAGRRVILSTGMATLAEVEDALAVLVLGYLEPAAVPTLARRRAAFATPQGHEALVSNAALLQCTTDYPASPSDANLRAMDTLRDTFGVLVGFSDHTSGFGVAVAAAARGAAIIEKHITLDRNRPGPDHQAALEPDEFAAMVRAIRDAEQALGSSEKVPSEAEAENRLTARRSLVAGRPIAKGERLSEDNVEVRRPATGASPMRYWDLLGQTAARSYETEEPIDQ